jgi:hypothetical protein
VKRLLIATSVIVLLSGKFAIADDRFDWQQPQVQVIAVEATYMPDRVSFKIDTDIDKSNPPCPKGTWLVWPGRDPISTQSPQANVEAVYSLLLAAKLTQTKVNVFGWSGNVDGFCAGVRFLHLQ